MRTLLLCIVVIIFRNNISFLFFNLELYRLIDLYIIAVVSKSIVQYAVVVLLVVPVLPVNKHTNALDRMLINQRHHDGR